MQPIPYRIVKKGLNYCYASTVLWSAFAPVVGGAVYIAMLLSMGMSDRQIGWTFALPMFAIPSQIIGAMIQRRWFNRKKFWFAGFMTHNLAFFAVFLLLCFWRFIPQTAGISFFFVFLGCAAVAMQSRSSVDMAWITELVPERDVVTFWNRNTAIGMVASVVFGLIIGRSADILGRGERSTFAVLLGIALIAAACCVWLRMMMPDPAPESAGNARPVKDDVKAIVANRDFKRLLLSVTVRDAGVWLSCAFIFVHLQRTMGFSLLMIQIFSAVSCIVSWLAASLFQVIGKRYGRKPVLIICMVCKAIEYILWGFMRPGDHWLDTAVRSVAVPLLGDWASLPEGVASVIPVFVIGGFVNVGIAAMQSAILGAIAPRRCNSLAIGIFFSIVGVAGGIISAASGSMHSMLATPGFGPDGLRALASGAGFTPFNVLAICGSAFMLLSAWILAGMSEPGSASAQHVVRVIFEANPFRGVYQAQTLSRPMSENARSGLLGHARGPLVSSAVAGDLFSSSSLVRHEAMRAILRADSRPDPAVCDTLMQLLSMPELGMQPDAAIALGRLRCERALPQLQALFDNPDMSLAVAALYSAGLVASEKALPELRNVVAKSQSAVCRAWAAESMSRIGDYHEADLIFDAYSACANQALSMQCLVSLCRCMCDRHEAYQVFDEETRSPGSRINQFLSAVHARGGCPAPDELMKRFDSGDYLFVAGAVLSPELRFCAPRNYSEGMPDDEFLASQFSSAGTLVDSRLDSVNYVSTSLRLQLRLWNCLRRTVERDPFVLLAVVYLADRLWKRLDPKYPRKNKPREAVENV